jgi:hypothetical protein
MGPSQVASHLMPGHEDVRATCDPTKTEPTGPQTSQSDAHGVLRLSEQLRPRRSRSLEDAAEMSPRRRQGRSDEARVCNHHARSFRGSNASLAKGPGVLTTCTANAASLPRCSTQMSSENAPKQSGSSAVARETSYLT